MRHISIFSYRTVNDWYSFPSSIVLSNSVNCLKSKLNSINIPCRLFFVQLSPNTHFAEAILRTRRGHTKSLTTRNEN